MVVVGSVGEGPLLPTCPVCTWLLLVAAPPVTPAACAPPQVEDLARLSFKNRPLYVGVDDSRAHSTREGLEQGYCVVPADKRLMLLFTFLKKNANKKVQARRGGNTGGCLPHCCTPPAAWPCPGATFTCLCAPCCPPSPGDGVLLQLRVC